MGLSEIFFPTMCPYCESVIGKDEESCGCLGDLTKYAAHKKILENGVRCYSLFKYDGIFRDAVVSYKYRGRRQFKKPFARSLSRLICENLGDLSFDIYTSVPGNSIRFGERFDQVYELALECSKLDGVPYKRLLGKTRKSAAQHTLNSEERADNVVGLYTVTSPSAVKGKRIALFDDVVTTGSTLSSCSSELLKSGASEVVCVTLDW